jgi:hypothetical protein
MKFPTKENDIYDLAINMATGFWNYAADFPAVDPYVLFNAIGELKDAQNVSVDAISQAKLEYKRKMELFETLKKVMKDCLKKSEVDAYDNPEKLAEIGWGPRANINHLQTPSQPTNLKAFENEDTTIDLMWKKGKGKQPVRNFIIERRQFSQSEFSNWQIVASSYDSHILLYNQPHRMNLEFRVKAVNPTGASLPSNTAYVTI